MMNQAKVGKREIGMGNVRLTPSRVQIATEAMDWRAAIRLVGRPLVEEGVVTEGYLDEVIATAERMGPYFDLGHGIAMPHARPEAGVNEIGVSVLRVDPPVSLLDLDDRLITVFIMLAATDSETHLDVMRDLAGVLIDAGRRQALTEATTIEGVLAVFGEIAAS